MPARCPTCGEEALTETAQFCIGCGGPLPEADVDAVLAELADALPEPMAPVPEPDDSPMLHLPELRTEPEPDPPPIAAPPPRSAPLPPRDDTPQFDPKPVPSRTTPTPAGAPPAKQQPPRITQFQPMKDTSPIVPLPLVIAGVIGLLALLLILLLAA